MNDMTHVLLNWYDKNRRILPWREDPSPYHVWLSEIMLQQTRVETGKEYYLRFLDVLPDIPSLAAASEEICMKLWEGLGYYSRVRNLHKAAVMIMEQYGGKMPDTAAELQKLPGIGAYTAAAIASIAFGKKEVATDGNLIRVFARMTEYEGGSREPAAKEAAKAYFAAIMPEERPGDFNQALMDLGATVCLPSGKPLCDRCPWKEKCLSHRDGKELSYPVMSEKKARKTEDRTVFLILQDGKVMIRQRPHEGLLADLYEFPNTGGHLSGKEALAFVETLGFPEGAIRKPLAELGEAKHIFTHIEWHMTGYAVFVDSAEDLPEHDRALIDASREDLLERYSIPSAFKAYKKKLDLLLSRGR